MAFSRLVKAFEDRSNLRPYAGLIEEYLSSRRSEKTSIALQDRFMAFIQWAEGEDASQYYGYFDSIVLPVPPEIIAHYADYLDGRGLRPGSILAYVSAMGILHRVVGFPTAMIDPQVRDVIDRLHRGYSNNPRQARALTLAEMDDVLRHLHIPRRVRRGGVETEGMLVHRAAIDRALLLTMVMAGLLVNEAYALRWQDLREEADGSGRVLVRSNNRARGSSIAVNSDCIEALAAVRQPGEPDDAHVFGLSGRQITRRLKRMCEEAGIDSSDINGHTPRATLVNLMTENGAPFEVIQKQCRLLSTSALSAYYASAPYGADPLDWL